MSDNATFDFDHIVDRRGTDSIKWHRYRQNDIIPMWVADMDFASSPAVLEALHRRVDHGVFGYGVPPAELVDTVIQRLLRLYNWAIEPEWIIWLPGLVTGLNVACRAVGAAGDPVLTATPVYPPFLTAPRFSLKKLQTAPLVLRNGNWQFDENQLERHMNDGTRLFMLCNPHNPVGRVFSREELTRVADLCIEHDVIICSDEIHCDLILDPACRHIPIASLDETINQRTITLMAPSKTYNLPGLGCSLAIIADAKLRRCFKQAMAGIVPDVNLMGYAAAAAAWRDRSGWLNQLLAYLRGNCDLVQDAVDAIAGLSMTPVQATYLAWIDTRSRGIEEPVAFFEKAGIGLSDGRDFGADGYVRLNFGCRRQLLQTALERLRTALP